MKKLFLNKRWFKKPSSDMMSVLQMLYNTSEKIINGYSEENFDDVLKDTFEDRAYLVTTDQGDTFFWPSEFASGENKFCRIKETLKKCSKFKLAICLNWNGNTISDDKILQFRYNPNKTKFLTCKYVGDSSTMAKKICFECEPYAKQVMKKAKKNKNLYCL